MYLETTVYLLKLRLMRSNRHDILVQWTLNYLGLILGQRRRRWTNIKTTLVKRPAFKGDVLYIGDY